MSVQLTATLKNLANQTTKQPQIILDIDGIPVIFGAQPILKLWSFDNGYILDTPNLLFDQPFSDPDSREYISIKNTTKNITNQNLPDKGGTGSISTAKIELVDVNQDVTRLFKNGENVADILGRDATLYISFAGASHPEDSIAVLSGYVDSYDEIAGGYLVSVTHPENLKRQDIFQPYNAKLTSDFLYKQSIFQNIVYAQRDKSAPTISIEYVSGGLDANFDRIANKLTVDILGTTTADEIVDLLETKSEIVRRLDFEVIGDGTTPQTTFSATPLQIDTTLNVDQTTNLLLSADTMTSKIRIEDEICRVISKTDTTITVERAIDGTTAFSYEPDTTVDSIYAFSDDPITLALKLYLSDSNKTRFGNADVKNINEINGSLFVQNALFLEGQNVVQDYNIVLNDFVTLTGSASDGTYKIIDIQNVDTGQLLIVDGTLATQTDVNATAQFLSQYNVYPDGLKMNNREVDINGHLFELNFNPNTFPTLNFNIDDKINGKEFIDREIYYPCSLYSVPRQSKVSVKLVKPPLTLEQTITLDESTVTNLDKVKIQRATHKFLYNEIVYKYNKDIINDKFLTGKVFINEESKNRIGAGRIVKTLTIEANGFVDSNETDNIINRQVQRLFDRYKNSAQQINNVEVLYGTGIGIEIGDVLIFGSETMPIADLNTGERIFKPRLVEVLKKSLSITTGKIKLDLLETAYDLESRFGVISFSSKIGVGSTTQKLILKRSFFTGDYEVETDKYQDYAGQRIRVRNEDYTFDETVRLIGADPSNENALLIADPLSVAPSEDFIVEQPVYDETDSDIDALYKDQFCFFNGELEVSASINNISFEVADASLLSVDYQTYIHNDDYSRDSFLDGTSIIADISGNVVTLDEAISFVPQVGDKIKLVGYKDGGFPYRIF